MKTSLVIEAIKAMDAAADALRSGNLSIAAQIKLASRVQTAGYRMQIELEKEFPDVQLEKEMT